MIVLFEGVSFGAPLEALECRYTIINGGHLEKDPSRGNRGMGAHHQKEANMNLLEMLMGNSETERDSRIS